MSVEFLIDLKEEAIDLLIKRDISVREGTNDIAVRTVSNVQSQLIYNLARQIEHTLISRSEK